MQSRHASSRSWKGVGEHTEQPPGFHQLSSAPHQRVITWSPVIRRGSGNEEGRADSTSVWGRRRIEGRAPQHSTTFCGTAMLVQAGPEGHFG